MAKWFSSERPGRKAAIACALINLAALPGGGSILAGRLVGIPQSLLTFAGFGLFMKYFLIIMKTAMNATDPDRVLQAARAHVRLGAAGVGLVAIAWLWSAFTSYSVWQQSKGTPPPLKTS